jgi:hypothetical protein
VATPRSEPAAWKKAVAVTKPPPKAPVEPEDSDDESIASGLTSEGSRSSPPPALKPAPAPTQEPPWPYPEESTIEPEATETGEAQDSGGDGTTEVFTTSIWYERIYSILFNYFV